MSAAATSADTPHDALRLAVLDDYQDAARHCADWSRLPPHVTPTFFHDNVSADRQALVERLQPFDIVCLMRERTRLDRELLSQLPRLKLLLTPAMVNASVDIGFAHERGVTVCGTGALETATPELTWALILALARNVTGETRGVANGQWQLSVGRDLHGATLGVVGLGRVGSRVAAVGKAFGMRVLGWSQNLTAERAAACGAQLASREEIFSQADFLALNLKLSDRTMGIIGGEDLARMKPSAFFINTARAQLVDEAALVQALRERRIAGAAIDVFLQEPLPADHPYRALDNVLLTPHVGYVTRDTYAQFYGEMLEDVLAWLDGKPIRVIDPHPGRFRLV